MKIRKRFYKDKFGWFIDLPEWPGPKDALQMVCGADHMLDIYSQGENDVTLTFSDTQFENADVLNIIQEGGEEGGAYYQTTTIDGFEFDFEVWLCDVTKFIFGEMPEKIYIKK